MRIIRKGIFLLLLAGILWLASYVCSSISTGANNLDLGRNNNVAGIQREREDSIDLLVLGDSESYTAVSPMRLWEKTGITSYICGQTGQKIGETWYFLKTALQNQSPRMVILETNLLFRYQGLTKEAQTAVSETGSYCFPVFRYHNLWKQLFGKKMMKTVNYKGFTIRDSVGAYKGGDYMMPSKEREKIEPAVRFYLDRIVRLCRKEGISLLLLSAPSPVNCTYQRHNAISDYAEQKEIDYLDLNLKLKELKIDWKVDSLDKGDHLNLSGAHKVTDYLSIYLKEQGTWTDHREDKDYQSWNMLSDAYEKQARKALKKIQDG